MVKGCGANSVKFIVLASNFAVCIVGLAIFGFSLYANLNKDFQSHLEDLISNNSENAELTKLQDFTHVIWALCVFGGLVFLVGFLGCCGAASENRCLLGLYFIVILVLTIVELGLTVTVLTQRGLLKSEITKIIDDVFMKDAEKLKAIETDFNCCGTNGTDNPKCAADKKPGCVDAMWEKVDTGLVWLGVVCVLAVLVQIFALVFACILCTAISKRDGYQQYS